MNARPNVDRARVDPSLLARRFVARFGARPRLFRAPGRINIIGEHTDYCDGYAMPAAIDRHCTVATALNGRDDFRILSVNMDEEAHLPGDTFVRDGRWSDYVGGVAAALRRAGHETPGCDMVIESDVPLGSGVSSSAALEVAATLAFLANIGVFADDAPVARWAREAETDFVGAPCGPMDQFASVHGKAHHALLLDCRALSATETPIPAGAAVVLIDSGVKHAIVDGGYAARRADCEAAAAQLGVRALRDATMDQVAARTLPDRLRRRARHVVTENARVLAAAVALRAGDCCAAGRSMSQSHRSLRDDFDVTCPETDLLAGLASGTPGVYGARQMGGGFGGCVIALVEADAAAETAQRISAAYERASGKSAPWFVCDLVDGAGEVAP